MNIFLLLFISIYSFSQEKTVFIYIPNSISKGGNDETTIYKIKTNMDGIVSSIEAINNQYANTPEIIIDENKITIRSTNNWVYAINEILFHDEEILVRGEEKSIYTKTGNNYTNIYINTAPDIIYEHEEIKLIKKNESSLEEIFKIDPSKFSGITYSNNVSISDYRFKNNIMFRFEYRILSDGISITYYYIGGAIYSVDIKIEGDSLYTNCLTTNVTNYFILKSARDIIATIFFPLVFLENPFILNPDYLLNPDYSEEYNLKFNDDIQKPSESVHNFTDLNIDNKDNELSYVLNKNEMNTKYNINFKSLLILSISGIIITIFIILIIRFKNIK